MSKYIIEIAEEYEEYFKGVLICGIADGKFAVDVIAREDLEELNSDYINEHYGSLQDEAYQRGYNDGKNVIDKGCEGCKYTVRFADDEPCKSCSNCYKNKYEPMPKEDDRIEVGDEVEWDGDKYVVTYLNYDIETSEITDYDLLAYDGSVVDHVKKCTFTKTGKHYDIASILEAMRT
jgi:hypothetical protein